MKVGLVFAVLRQAPQTPSHLIKVLISDGIDYNSPGIRPESDLYLYMCAHLSQSVRVCVCVSDYTAFGDTPYLHSRACLSPASPPPVASNDSNRRLTHLDYPPPPPPPSPSLPVSGASSITPPDRLIHQLSHTLPPSLIPVIQFQGLTS